MNPVSVQPLSRPLWKRILMGILILVGTLFSSSLAAAYGEKRIYGHTVSQAAGNLTILGFLASMAVAVALCFRHRPGFLLNTAGIACLPPLLLPTDSLPALIGMASVLVWHHHAHERAGFVIAAAVATFVAIFRDTRGTSSGQSFWNSLEHSDTATGTWPPMPVWQVLLITVLLVALFAGVALIRRSRHEVAAVTRQKEVVHQQVHDLGRQITEQDEREALAREVHDVLGHRLSILSMQAGALEIEAEAAGSRELQDRAHQIQQGASGAMSDLRSLLAMLREGHSSAERPHELSDIADLVRECISAGTPVHSSIFIDQSTPLDPIISRSAHRITTELLTNARKHAPGHPVQLDIQGSPATGLRISTNNPITKAAPGIGSGSGLVGLHRRATDVGGCFTAGPTPDHRHYHATAELPWNTPR